MLSLPSRECGLKFISLFAELMADTSLPSRECGLKFAGPYTILFAFKSLPSRECGLKYVQRVIDIAVVCVTPFAGVWIEIGINF